MDQLPREIIGRILGHVSPGDMNHLSTGPWDICDMYADEETGDIIQSYYETRPRLYIDESDRVRMCGDRFISVQNVTQM